MATYKQSSPYKSTLENETGEFLGLFRIRTIPAQSDDCLLYTSPSPRDRG